MSLIVNDYQADSKKASLNTSHQLLFIRKRHVEKYKATVYRSILGESINHDDTFHHLK